jgi:predicted RNA polymerase sigma factor
MLLTDARRPARTTVSGELVPLAEQDRSRWDHDAIREGVELITEALAQGPLGAYQLQAAIAAVHDEAARPEDTDWRQIVALYELLDQVAPNPMATINRAVAIAMVHGAPAGLKLLATLDGESRVWGHHLLYAVWGHLLEMAGQAQDAVDEFRHAARITASLPEKRYLQARAGRVENLSLVPTPVCETRSDLAY